MESILRGEAGSRALLAAGRSHVLRLVQCLQMKYGELGEHERTYQSTREVIDTLPKESDL